jgi:AcrR family transcriptional regulator
MSLAPASARQQDHPAADTPVAKPAVAAQPAARQERVLAAVLDLMMTAGPHFSMADVARAAACSKETLYRWFGDRDGLLTATVQWQAAKVLMPVLPDAGLDRATYQAALAAFAASWIGVISGEPSIALNRQAVGESGGLGRIVLENGPLAMARRSRSAAAKDTSPSTASRTPSACSSDWWWATCRSAACWAIPGARSQMTSPPVRAAPPPASWPSPTHPPLPASDRREQPLPIPTGEADR